MISSVIFIAIESKNLKKPSRSDCIIGFELDWSHVRNTNQTRNSMTLPIGKRRVKEIAARSLELDGSRIYFQSSKLCADKQRQAESVIRYWHDEGLDLPKFSKIQREISLNEPPIQVSGRSWSD